MHLLNKEYQKIYQKYVIEKDPVNISKTKITFFYTVFPRFITNKMLSPIYSNENNFYNLRNSKNSLKKAEIIKKIEKYQTLYFEYYKYLKEDFASYYYLEVQDIIDIILIGVNEFKDGNKIFFNLIYFSSVLSREALWMQN